MTVHADADIDDLPGADLVLRGIEDLERGRDTVAAALAQMAGLTQISLVARPRSSKAGEPRRSTWTSV